MRVVLDPGHGGSDSGAVGATGLREADVVLAVCRYLDNRLRAMGWQVHMTRADDRFVPLGHRADLANSLDANLFVSVHANSFHQREAHGFEVWTSPWDTLADPVATRIYNSVLTTFPSLTGRQDLSDGDPDKEGRFTVLTRTRMPAVLVELAFISNLTEEAWLADPFWQIDMAYAIAVGIGVGA